MQSRAQVACGSQHVTPTLQKTATTPPEAVQHAWPTAPHAFPWLLPPPTLLDAVLWSVTWATLVLDEWLVPSVLSPVCWPLLDWPPPLDALVALLFDASLVEELDALVPQPRPANGERERRRAPTTRVGCMPPPVVFMPPPVVFMAAPIARVVPPCSGVGAAACSNRRCARAGHGLTVASAFALGPLLGAGCIMHRTGRAILPRLCRRPRRLAPRGAGRADDVGLRQNLVTRLEIAIDEAGNIRRMGVVTASGVEEFDVAVLDAVSRAQPFGRTAPTIRSSDGNVYIQWQFHRNEVFACGTQGARPFLLDL